MAKEKVVLVTRKQAVDYFEVSEELLGKALLEINPEGYWNNPTIPVYSTRKIAQNLKELESYDQ